MLAIECRISRSADSGARHEVLIRDDWSVVTPHDLDAERVAVAFGGYTSCLELVDRTVPRLRESLLRVDRRTRPVLRRDKCGSWRVPTREMAGCCRSRAFRSLRATVEHLSSPAHLTNLLDLSPWQVGEIVGQANRACRPVMSGASSIARFVREPDGLRRLWQSGIHPEQVPQLAAYASVLKEPLPVAFFEGIVYSGHRPEWLNDLLAYRRDADTAAWLAWQAPPDVLSDPRDWGLWLAYGLSRRDFASAVERSLPASMVRAIAEQTGWPARTAARVAVGYGKADCYPSPEHLAMIARLGMEHSIPGKAAVDAAAEEAARTGAHVDRTELALMLAVVGNRPLVLAAVRRGARTVSDLDLARPLW